DSREVRRPYADRRAGSRHRPGGRIHPNTWDLSIGSQMPNDEQFTGRAAAQSPPAGEPVRSGEPMGQESTGVDQSHGLAHSRERRSWIWPALFMASVAALIAVVSFGAGIVAERN